MPDTVEVRDVELMRRLAEGDEDAFVEFYRRFQGGIYRYALHMAGRPDAAADVVQETFLSLMRQARKFDEEKGAPGAFLYGIARNHLRKLWEKEGRYVAFNRTMGGDGETGWDGDDMGRNGNHNGGGRRLVDAVEPETVLQGLERAETVRILREAVLTLPEHYREPVTLCDLEGKSYSEASTLLECPVGTVRSRLNRARSILLEKLRPNRLGAKALGAGSGGKS
jgi:RNA polymerase sigma-70 factor (ECF subfamily)